MSEFSESIDGLSRVQAHKFVVKLGLKNLRKENGYWVADIDYGDGNLEPYTIDTETYWAAWYEGDLA